MWYLVLTSFIWAFSFPLIGGQLRDVDPVLAAAIRLALSLLVFLPFLQRLPIGLVWRAMAIGAVQFGAMYCFYIASYAYLAAHEIALLTITTPLFVVLTDALLAKRAVPDYWLAALLAVAAALVLAVEGTDGQAAWRGVVLIQAANVCFAAGQVAYKRFRQYAGHNIKADAAIFGWLYLGAVMVPVLVLIATGMGAWPTRPAQWWSLLYLGVLPSGLGFFLWNRGVRFTDNGTAAVMNNLKIPLGATAAWLLLSETLHWQRILPATLLFGLALWLSLTRPFSRNDQAPADSV